MSILILYIMLYNKKIKKLLEIYQQILQFFFLKNY